MIAHTSLPVSNYRRAKKFYSKVLATLGYRQNMEYGEAAGFNDGRNTDFWIGTNEKGIVPLHVAFEAGSKAQVDRFYQAALAAGAHDNGAPGYRKDYWPGYYAAFVYDADGHNIEAVCLRLRREVVPRIGAALQTLKGPDANERRAD